MKLYIITIDEVFDFASYHHMPIVCLSREDAAKKIEELYIEAKTENSEDYDGEEHIEGKSFSLYPDGYWGTSHYDAHVDEVELPSFTLNAVFGESASKEAADTGFDNCAKEIENGRLDGSIESVSFDTEADRQKAIGLLESADGWLGTFWEIPTN